MTLGVNEQMPILKANRLSTGIADLDLILEGGYINPGNIVIVGPSGIEKAALGYHFAASAKEGENAYIICGNSSPEDIVGKASTLGMDLSKTHFIDCYTSTLGKSELQDTPMIKRISGPSALNDISLALNEAIAESSGRRMRLVFDTLSTFVLYNEKDSIRKFLSVIEGRLKNARATTLYLIDEGVHDRQLVSLIEHGMDDRITLVDNSGKMALQVSEVGMDIPVRVGPTGITII